MPSAVTRTFDGLMSRCRTPRSWACSSASASRAPHQAIGPGVAAARPAPSRPADGPPAGAPSRLEPVERRDQLRAADRPPSPPGRPGPGPASPGRSRACRAGAGRSPGRSGTSGPGRCACAGAGPASAARASPARATFSATGRSAELPLLARGRPGRTPPRPSSSTRWNPAIVCPASGNGDRRARAPAPSEAGRGGVPEPTRPWMSSTRRSGRRPRGTGRRYSAGSGRLAVLLAEAELLVDQGDERPRRRGRGSGRGTTRPRPSRPPPSAGQVGAEEGQPGAGRRRRRRAGSRRGRGGGSASAVPPGGLEPPGEPDGGGRRRPRPRSGRRGGRGSSRAPPAPAPTPAAEVFQHALDGPLADPEPLADVLAGEPLGLQLQDRPALLGHRSRSRPNASRASATSLAVSTAAARSRGWSPSAQSGSSRCMSCFRLPARRYSSITLFFAARARKATRCRESSNSAGAAPDPAEEAPPDALEEVERVEPRPQQPGQLPADDQPDLGLVPRQQLARRVLVPGVIRARNAGMSLSSSPGPPSVATRIDRHGRLLLLR